MCVCVCVCVCARARARARVCAYVCVCVCAGVGGGVLLFVVFFSVSFCFVFANFANFVLYFVASFHQCTPLIDFFQMKCHCDC